MRHYLVPAMCDAAEKADERYSQQPSYEMNSRRPVVPPAGGATKLRTTTPDEGVSFREPIRRDWE